MEERFLVPRTKEGGHSRSNEHPGLPGSYQTIWEQTTRAKEPIVVKTYKSDKEFQRDANKMGRKGYEV